MKQNLFVIFILIVFIGFILFGCFQLWIPYWILFFLIITMAVLSIVVVKKRYVYQCSKCKTILHPTKREYILGLNGGTQKLLFCPVCNKKMWCDYRKIEKNAP